MTINEMNKFVNGIDEEAVKMMKMYLTIEKKTRQKIFTYETNTELHDALLSATVKTLKENRYGKNKKTVGTTLYRVFEDLNYHILNEAINEVNAFRTTTGKITTDDYKSANEGYDNYKNCGGVLTRGYKHKYSEDQLRNKNKCI